MAGRKLTRDLQRKVTARLASFESVPEICSWLEEEHGIEISRSSIYRYDPTNNSHGDLRAELVDFFWDTRRQYLDNVQSVPIAHQRYRMEQAQKALESAQEEGDYYNVKQILEYAAKDLGGKYTNQVDVNVRHTLTERIQRTKDRLEGGDGETEDAVLLSVDEEDGEKQDANGKPPPGDGSAQNDAEKLERPTLFLAPTVGSRRLSDRWTVAELERIDGVRLPRADVK